MRTRRASRSSRRCQPCQPYRKAESIDGVKIMLVIGEATRYPALWIETMALWSEISPKPHSGDEDRHTGSAWRRAGVCSRHRYPPWLCDTRVLVAKLAGAVEACKCTGRQKLCITLSCGTERQAPSELPGQEVMRHQEEQVYSALALDHLEMAVPDTVVNFGLKLRWQIIGHRQWRSVE